MPACALPATSRRAQAVTDVADLVDCASESFSCIDSTDWLGARLACAGTIASGGWNRSLCSPLRRMPLAVEALALGVLSVSALASLPVLLAALAFRVVIAFVLPRR